MKELLRTNDLVLISFVEATLSDAEVPYYMADHNMSVLEGSLGVLPRRVLVREDDWREARRVLTTAGVAADVMSQAQDTDRDSF